MPLEQCACIAEFGEYVFGFHPVSMAEMTKVFKRVDKMNVDLCLPPFPIASDKPSEVRMLFMVIERFKDNDMVPVYQHVRNAGRMLPDGLIYLDSWVEPAFRCCFQLMQCDDVRLIQEWILKWRGLGVTFEVVPVVRSKDTRELVEPYLETSDLPN